MKHVIAEFLGTFIILFCGTGAMVISQETGGTIDHLGITICFAIAVTVSIYAFQSYSAAHFNPAVSISLWTVGLFPGKKLVPYIGSQFAGAISATLLLHLLFPNNQQLGITLPRGSFVQSFVLECILGILLIVVVLFTSQGKKSTRHLDGILIGATILLAALFAGPISGASMNPARSLAPALVSGTFTAIWIYLTAPIVGMVAGAFIWKKMQ